MFRIILLTALALAIAIGGGTASVWYALDEHEGFGAQRIGPWTADLADAAQDADPYTAARRARVAQLPLGIAEGMAFHARVDDQGRALGGDCNYVLEGNVPAARLWTLHVADPALIVVAQDERAPGLHSRQILRRADSSFVISVGSRPVPGNWIATPARKPFVLVLTLFDTPVTSTLRATEQTYPEIRRIDCA